MQSVVVAVDPPRRIKKRLRLLGLPQAEPRLRRA
jgi:hypothetical protein